MISRAGSIVCKEIVNRPIVVHRRRGSDFDISFEKLQQVRSLVQPYFIDFIVKKAGNWTSFSSEDDILSTAWLRKLLESAVKKVLCTLLKIR